MSSDIQLSAELPLSDGAAPPASPPALPETGPGAPLPPADDRLQQIEKLLGAERRKLVADYLAKTQGKQEAAEEESPRDIEWAGGLDDVRLLWCQRPLGNG